MTKFPNHSYEFCSSKCSVSSFHLSLHSIWCIIITFDLTTNGTEHGNGLIYQIQPNWLLNTPLCFSELIWAKRSFCIRDYFPLIASFVRDFLRQIIFPFLERSLISFLHDQSGKYSTRRACLMIASASSQVIKTRLHNHLKQVRIHDISRSPSCLCPPSKSVTDQPQVFTRHYGRTNGRTDGHTLL